MHTGAHQNPKSSLVRCLTIHSGTASHLDNGRITQAQLCTCLGRFIQTITRPNRSSISTAITEKLRLSRSCYQGNALGQWQVISTWLGPANLSSNIICHNYATLGRTSFDFSDPLIRFIVCWDGIFKQTWDLRSNPAFIKVIRVPLHAHSSPSRITILWRASSRKQTCQLRGRVLGIDDEATHFTMADNERQWRSVGSPSSHSLRWRV